MSVSISNIAKLFPKSFSKSFSWIGFEGGVFSHPLFLKLSSLIFCSSLILGSFVDEFIFPGAGLGEGVACCPVEIGFLGSTILLLKINKL